MVISSKSSTFASTSEKYCLMKNRIKDCKTVFLSICKNKPIMINLRKEIETCLQTLKNSNNKEQNFQGRLYAYFLKFEKEGYIVEMETSIKDDHIPFFNELDTNKFYKKEIDLLIYKQDYSEKYAIELKWIYHQDGSGKWNVLDNLPSFEKDLVFVKQLKEIAHFTETCSIVVYDADPEKTTKPSKHRKNAKNERPFAEDHIICGEKFDLLPLPSCNKKNQDYWYYIISF